MGYTQPSLRDWVWHGFQAVPFVLRVFHGSLRSFKLSFSMSSPSEIA
jgi:hypothetical protein